jgi:Family of unknown function (DUF6338)
MPTTLTGLLLFVVLLLPGFAHLVGKERYAAERRMSPFRETVAVVVASITCELVVLVIFAGVRARWPSITPNVDALMREGNAYLTGSTGQPGHFSQFVIWGLGLLIAAVLLAYLATLPSIRRKLKWIFGLYPHESAVSSWWVLFERWREGRQIEIICSLDDGSAVSGKFGSFNIAADDSPDRDLILLSPLYYTPPGEEEPVVYPVSAVCIAARSIVAMFVNYTASGVVSPSSSDAAVAAQAASLEAQQQVQPPSSRLPVPVPVSAPSQRPARRSSALYLRQGGARVGPAVPHGRRKLPGRNPRGSQP